MKPKDYFDDEEKVIIMMILARTNKCLMQIKHQVHSEGARGDPHQRVLPPMPSLFQDLQDSQRFESSHDKKTQPAEHCQLRHCH